LNTFCSKIHPSTCRCSPFSKLNTTTQQCEYSSEFKNYLRNQIEFFRKLSQNKSEQKRGTLFTFPAVFFIGFLFAFLLVQFANYKLKNFQNVPAETKPEI